MARAPMSGKMAPGTWQKWYDGAWSQPGVGGRESNIVPVDSSNANGYTPVADDYDPANTGNVDQQIAAGTLPANSKLTLMSVAYNAQLGLYLGAPQVMTPTPGPQDFYVTDDLSTQKWHLIGNTGNYKHQAWYRWFLDSVNKTSSTILGKSFRIYCSIDCSTGGGEYVNVSIDSSSPAAPPVDSSTTYAIANGGGRVLAQVSGSSATTSLSAATGSGLESWVFRGNGDGSYRIVNASTGQLLGVDSSSAAYRAWGTKPTVTAPGPGGPTVGQQWFIVADTSPANVKSGAYRLVNRYSGLVLGLSSDSTRLAETTPQRNWTDSTGSTVGKGRSAAEQKLTFTPTGTAPGTASGPITGVGGKCVDVTNGDSADSTPLQLYVCNGTPAQTWTVQGDGTVRALGKCMDVRDGATTAGTVVQLYTCNGTPAQNWTYQTDKTLKNPQSGLCLDASGGSSADGTPLIIWTCTATQNQQWTLPS
ncbi:RICIN domain-containing protein [Kribbella sp. NPDC050459]|uniref:RICIN domain-containing protein n=1 Tax=Kribbella sp. NPDC050459 TaxID=3155785 RepID=UPI0033CDC71D